MDLLIATAILFTLTISNFACTKATDELTVNEVQSTFMDEKATNSPLKQNPRDNITLQKSRTGLNLSNLQYGSIQQIILTYSPYITQEYPQEKFNKNAITSSQSSNTQVLINMNNDILDYINERYPGWGSTENLNT